MLNMFRALLCPSSGAHDYSADYHVGRRSWAAGCSLQPRHLSNLPPPNFQPTATQERDGQRGNQHYSRELLMMGITGPQTC